MSPILTSLSPGVALNLVPVITTLSPAAPVNRDNITVIVVSVEAVTSHGMSPILTLLSSGVALNLVPVITTLSPAAPVNRDNITVIVVSVEAVTSQWMSPIVTSLSSGVALNLVITTLSPAAPVNRDITVKPVLSGHSPKNKKWVSRPIIAKCRSKALQNAPRGSILQYFWPALSYHMASRPFLSIFEWPLKTGFTVLLFITAKFFSMSVVFAQMHQFSLKLSSLQQKFSLIMWNSLGTNIVIVKRIDCITNTFLLFSIKCWLSRLELTKLVYNVFVLVYLAGNYSITCVKWPFSKRQKIGFQYQ